jgi:hypothetical protein
MYGGLMAPSHEPADDHNPDQAAMITIIASAGRENRGTSRDVARPRSAGSHLATDKGTAGIAAGG